MSCSRPCDLTTLAQSGYRIRFRANALRMSGAAYDKLRASEFLIRVRLSSLRPAERSRRYGDAVFPHPVSEDRRSIVVMGKRTAMPIRDRRLGICVSGQMQINPAKSGFQILLVLCPYFLQMALHRLCQIYRQHCNAILGTLAVPNSDAEVPKIDILYPVRYRRKRALR